MSKSVCWYIDNIVKYFVTKPHYKKEYGSFKKYCEVKRKYEFYKSEK